jgi:prepilin-type N-terminal cleavage/methylation domain-containing protein
MKNLQKLSHSSREAIRAFTLIELLVVIAIIALLSGILMVNFTSARGKARDAKRISDLGQLQLSLELYFDRCKQYPATLTTGASNCQASGITLGTYISQIPTPPASTLNQTSYDYAVNGSAPSNYVLHTQLEYVSDSQKDSLSDSTKEGSGETWASMTCHNIPTDLNYCVGPK